MVRSWAQKNYPNNQSNKYVIFPHFTPFYFPKFQRISQVINNFAYILTPHRYKSTL